MKRAIMILICAAAATTMLAACSPSYERQDFPVLPEELKDCKFFRVSNGTYTINVVRCPNSDTGTTYMEGKVRRYVTTTDRGEP